MVSRFYHPRKASSRAAIVMLLLVLFSQQGIWGAIKPSDPRLDRINELKATYGKALKTPALDNGTGVSSTSASRPARLGTAAGGPASRGALIAQTWRDWHANANANRTVAVTTAGNTYGTGVQFAFMKKTSGLTSDRTKWAWQAWDATAGAFVNQGGIIIPPTPSAVEAGSYPKILIQPRNARGIMGSYDYPDQQNDPNFTHLHLAFEAPTAFSGNFGNLSGGSIMADTLNRRGNIADTSYHTIWPALGMTVTATDTVLYLFGFEAIGANDRYGALKVFRHLSTARSNPDNLWQLVFTDTSFFPTQDFATSRVSSRVAAVWTNQTPAGRISGTQEDNDVFYATSPSGLAGTWTKSDLTHYTGPGYRAWLECNALFDSADKLHIIWNAAVTDGITFLADRSCRLFHWSEYNPGIFSTVYSAMFSAFDLKCVGGLNVMNVGKFSLGECDGHLYTVFSDWNDPQLMPADSLDDCAAGAGWLLGGNGELYVTVSNDLTGVGWDRPRNLSHSYAKNCDTSGNCADDRWASISEVGIDNSNQPGIWPPSALVDPSGSYSGSDYTQVLYVTDRYPGGAVLDPPEGPFTLNDMRWIRLACVPAVASANLLATPGKIDFPAYVKPTVEKDTTIVLENVGNVDLAFTSIDTHEDSCKGPGCQSGWLGYSGITGTATIPMGGTANMTLRLNMTGIISNTTAPHRLWGSIAFNYGPPSQSTTFPISFTIADSVANTVFDTIITSASIKLVVGNNGNAGNNSAGQVNLNFPPSVECDTGNNSRGNAFIYLGDASPVILRKVGTAPTRASWSIFSQGYTNSNGFKPLPPGPPFDAFHGNAPAHSNAARWQSFFSGTFATVDSLLKVEKTWYAPSNLADSANFVVEKMQVWPATPGTAVTNLAIGMAYDWDIPADSGSFNYGGTDATRRLVWQRGFNSPNDTIVRAHGDTAAVLDCFNNSLRYGGSALVAMTNEKFIDSCQYTFDTLYGGYTARNDSFVYKNNGFVPEELWNNMQTTGYFNQDGTNTYTDLHTVLTFRNKKNSSDGGWTIPAQAHDTFTVYSIMAVSRGGTSPANALLRLDSTIDRGKKWANYWVRGCRPCCVGKRGDINLDGVISLSDLSWLVAYLTGNVTVLPCYEAANINGFGIVDIMDLAWLVVYLTDNGVVIGNCP